LIVVAYYAAAVCALRGSAMPVAAQEATELGGRPPAIVATSAPRRADPMAAEELRKRVQDALHADPYFDDGHVTVFVESGDVTMRGFVSSDWDLMDAIRIAARAAGDTRVVDYLSIEQGGRR
jgi:hypothetical protein